MKQETKDLLVYGASAATGALLARSFGAKLLGLAMGGTAGIAIAAWSILNKTGVSGEPPNAPAQF
jgi:hypothetical protein